MFTPNTFIPSHLILRKIEISKDYIERFSSQDYMENVHTPVQALFYFITANQS